MATFLRRLYTFAFACLLPLLLLRLVARARGNRAYLDRIGQRFGLYHHLAHSYRNGSGVIWLHAVSVGESMAAVPLIRALHEQYRDVAMVVTTTTPTGAETIARMLGDIVQHVYFPYDLPFILDRFMATFRPRLCVVLETELWPNLFALCRQRSVPLVLANARLSPRSSRGYRRLQPLCGEVLRDIRYVAAQTEEDAERFLELGANPASVEVLGSLKFDLSLPASLREEAEALRRELGVSRPILMAGSTRAGEEAILLAALRLLTNRIPEVLLVIAPRHPERFAEVIELCHGAGLKLARRSVREPCAADTRVYLVDGMGELPKFYAAADVAFVGGSLLPLGGHNVLEPASVGIPVLVGPHTFNFAAICRLLDDCGALRVVNDAAELAAASAEWLGDSNERDRLGHLGQDIVRRHRGATERTVGVLRALLDDPSASPLQRNGTR